MTAILAQTVAAARYRIDRATSLQPKETGDPRRPSAAALQRRWIIERTNAWLGNFRRLVVRYDRSLTIYGAFFHIACFMIVLRRVVQ